jgi:hypothetical protein
MLNPTPAHELLPAARRIEVDSASFSTLNGSARPSPCRTARVDGTSPLRIDSELVERVAKIRQALILESSCPLRASPRMQRHDALITLAARSDDGVILPIKSDDSNLTVRCDDPSGGPGMLTLWDLLTIRKSVQSTCGSFGMLVAAVSQLLRTRAALQLENVAMRHQMNVLQ